MLIMVNEATSHCTELVFELGLYTYIHSLLICSKTHLCTAAFSSKQTDTRSDNANYFAPSVPFMKVERIQ